MSVAQVTRDFISNIDNGKIFTYDSIPSNKKSTVAIELSRLYKQGTIKKLSRGKYYKSRQTAFGEVGPSSQDKLESYMNSSTASYTTGLDSFRKLGLTTQVPNVITIASDRSNQRVKVDNLNIKFVRKRVDAPANQTYLLKILDALKDIKSIPGTSVNEALKKLKNIIFKLNVNQQKKLAVYVTKYTPRTKVLLGAILKDLGLWEEAYKIKQQLNPLTKYKLGISDGALKNKKEWGII